MQVADAKVRARAWVELNLARWPGLRAAHLVGGVTSMPNDAPFPVHKDLDLHLIFADGSRMLEPNGHLFTNLEEVFDGVAIEAGIKPVSDYATAAAVLANPEVAYHLTVESVLYDPDGLLRDRQAVVRREYRRRSWVRARIKHERQGFGRPFAMRSMAAELLGPSGEVSMLGYATTFLTATLQVARLKPPRMGTRMFLRLREELAGHGRLDLYDELLSIMGLDRVTPEQAETFLAEGAAAFDLAMEVMRTPHPAHHKLHRHLRPYFVDACRSLLDEGHHAEATAWMILYFLISTDVVRVDGAPAERARAEAQQTAFLTALGLESSEARDAAFAAMAAFSDRIFVLADEIVATHPEIVD